jgi:hypothetical protein
VIGFDITYRKTSAERGGSSVGLDDTSVEEGVVAVEMLVTFEIHAC